MPADDAAIRTLIERWQKLSADGNLEGVLELVTDDVTFLRYGAAPMGKAEFADGFKDWSRHRGLESTVDVRDVAVNGDLAYAWSRLEVAMTALSSGDTVRREGDTLTVFRKDKSGKWRVHRDANLLAPPRT